MKTLLAAALVVLIGSPALGAQEVPEPQPREAIPNWSAPPRWSPGTSVAQAQDPAEPEDLSKLGVPTPALHFVGIAPCRIVDTRGNGAPIQGGAYAASEARNYTLTGQCAIPPGAEAVSLNVTVTQAAGPGFILMYPQGSPPPPVSTLNYLAGDTLANAAVVPLGAAGGITVVAGVSGTHLILDTNGYYAPFPTVNTINTLSGNVTLAAGSNISITPAGQTLTIANTAPPAWLLGGNSGTTSGTNFLGTTDNQALEFKVGGAGALRLEPGGFGIVNVIGGTSNSSVTAGVVGATIGGGYENIVTDDYGTVGGGPHNRAGDNAGSTGDSSFATVGGGDNNVASGFAATVAGGRINTASGDFATVPGGIVNTAAGNNSFAAGLRAKANHTGTFVWGDDTAADIASTGNNQFIVRASGGARFLRGTSLHSFTFAGLQAEHAGSAGEAAWFYTTNAANTTPVIKLLKNAAGTNNFLECENFGVARKCHITSAGSFVAGSDFAEALPVKGGKAGYEPGDVLVISRDAVGGVEKTSRPYDVRILGVYSTRPGFIGADKNGDTRIDPDEVPVAITGIVPTKVTSENGSIEPGDLLTSSSKPGYAMKARVEVNGVAVSPPPGSILGKALQPLKGESGVIQVLVMQR